MNYVLGEHLWLPPELFARNKGGSTMKYKIPLKILSDLSHTLKNAFILTAVGKICSQPSPFRLTNRNQQQPCCCVWQ